jgi:FkbM family methyltransferase
MARTLDGVRRSLRLYYGDPARAAAMDRLYRPFVPAGALAFDIGAHIGDRVASFRRLGARVVAVEPQPALHRTLRLLHGRDTGVTLLSAAVGRVPGRATMRINTANPTISTLSDEFIEASRGASGWQGEAWPVSAEVEVTTLDALIAAHGRPAFIKLDIEGFEAEALAGLTRPVAGAVVRVHDHPAPGGARLPRPLHGTRLHNLQCGAGREPATRRLARCRGDGALARRPAARCQLRRYLRRLAIGAGHCCIQQ